MPAFTRSPSLHQVSSNDINASSGVTVQTDIEYSYGKEYILMPTHCNQLQALVTTLFCVVVCGGGFGELWRLVRKAKV
jgi:hypothetical protein